METGQWARKNHDVLEQVLIVAGLTVLVLISPGPDMALVLRNTLIGGRLAGVQTSLGILSGNLVHISYCVAGIGWLISQSIVAFSVLKYAGAAYLLYLGLQSFRESRTPVAPAGGEPNRGRNWYLQGLINNVLNPKGTLFYLGIFTVVITPETGALGMLFLILTMMLICALFWLIFVLTLDRPAIRDFLEKSQVTVNRIFGAVLIMLAVRVASIER